MPATEGSAHIAGFDIFEQPLAARRAVGYLPESPPLYPEMEVVDYLDFVGRLKGIAAADLAQGLRRLPRLIDSLHIVAEHERRKVERVEAEVESALTRWTRDIGYAEVIAVLALIAAIVAWWH